MDGMCTCTKATFAVVCEGCLMVTIRRGSREKTIAVRMVSPSNLSFYVEEAQRLVFDPKAVFVEKNWRIESYTPPAPGCQPGRLVVAHQIPVSIRDDRYKGKVEVTIDGQRTVEIEWPLVPLYAFAEEAFSALKLDGHCPSPEEWILVSFDRASKAEPAKLHVRLPEAL